MENSHRFFQNRECRYFPCHEGIEELNCLFCYCPFYVRNDCPGNPVFWNKEGVIVKDCTDCTFPHRPESYDVITAWLKIQNRKREVPEEIRKHAKPLVSRRKKTEE